VGVGTGAGVVAGEGGEVGGGLAWVVGTGGREVGVAGSAAGSAEQATARIRRLRIVSRTSVDLTISFIYTAG
jgi:hypothetical protein